MVSKICAFEAQNSENYKHEIAPFISVSYYIQLVIHTCIKNSRWKAGVLELAMQRKMQNTVFFLLWSSKQNTDFILSMQGALLFFSY